MGRGSTFSVPGSASARLLCHPACERERETRNGGFRQTDVVKVLNRNNGFPGSLVIIKVIIICENTCAREMVNIVMSG